LASVQARVLAWARTGATVRGTGALQSVTLLANSLARLEAYETPLGEAVLRELGAVLARADPGLLSAAQAAMVANAWARASI